MNLTRKKILLARMARRGINGRTGTGAALPGCLTLLRRRLKSPPNDLQASPALQSSSGL